ncbi:hypothetical protein APA_350 [Pseudanabaena sp. lw0831]|nr:hypothetical protein APA_350 [Pseudanabaena sp. lw0831]
MSNQRSHYKIGDRIHPKSSSFSEWDGHYLINPFFSSRGFPNEDKCINCVTNWQFPGKNHNP